MHDVLLSLRCQRELRALAQLRQPAASQSISGAAFIQHCAPCLRASRHHGMFAKGQVSYISRSWTTEPRAAQMSTNAHCHSAARSCQLNSKLLLEARLLYHVSRPLRKYVHGGASGRFLPPCKFLIVGSIYYSRRCELRARCSCHAWAPARNASFVLAKTFLL